MFERKREMHSICPERSQELQQPTYIGSIVRLKPEIGYLGTHILRSLVQYLPGPYLILWIRGIGLTLFHAGLLFAASMTSLLLIEFLSGGLADKYGRRLIFGVGMFMDGLGTILIAVSTNFLQLLLAFIISGAGTAFTSSSLEAWLYDEVKKEDKVQQVFSKSQIIEGIVGVSAGILASSLAHFALNLPILATGLVGIFTSFFIIVLLTENYGTQTRFSYLIVLRRGLKEFVENNILRLIAVSAIFMSFVISTFTLYWVILLEDVFSLPSEYAGIAYSLLLLAMSGGGLLSELLAKKVDYRKLPIIATIVWGLIFIALPTLTHHLIFGLLALMFIEVMYSIRRANLLTFQNSVIPSSSRATVLSGLSALIGFSSAAMQPLTGAMIDVYGISVVYQVAGVIAILSCFWLAEAYRRASK